MPVQSSGRAPALRAEQRPLVLRWATVPRLHDATLTLVPAAVTWWTHGVMLAAAVIEWGLLGRICVAFGLAFALGFEREVRGAPAGDRTYGLVGASAAAVTAVLIGRSPQAIAGVLTGIGFIGAGMVFRGHEGMLTGVTSAATLLGVVAVGIVAGDGHLLLAVALAALIMVDLELRYIPFLRALDGRRYTGRMRSDSDPPDMGSPPGS